MYSYMKDNEKGVKKNVIKKTLSPPHTRAIS